jgi:CHAT domain-containing protein
MGELSAIVLGQVNNPEGIDGYITAGEWAGYNLKSDLMVLSACETGLDLYTVNPLYFCRISYVLD